jgi:hypothetical protein
MRRVLVLSSLLLACVAATGQVVVGNYGIQYVGSPPSGSCGSSSPLTVVGGTGAVYTCQSGTWGLLSGGGGGGTPAGSNGAIQYNNSGSFGGSAATADAAGNIAAVASLQTGVPATTNGLQLNSVAAGTAPSITATGPDTNINITLTPKGTGGVTIPTGNFVVNAGGISATSVGQSNIYGISLTRGSGVAQLYSSTGTLTLGGNSTGAGGVQFETAGTTSPYSMVIDNTGKVGIGTNTPGAQLDVKGTMKVASLTVATLPTCNAGAQGLMSAVTDATTPTYLGTLTGGGTTYTPVTCNGTAWVAY